MTDRTQEPWHVRGDWSVVAIDDISVAICNPERPEAETNARFIAAAPDMEKALDGLLRMCFEDLSGEESGAIVEVALAALAKARGK